MTSAKPSGTPRWVGGISREAGLGRVLDRETGPRTCRQDRSAARWPMINVGAWLLPVRLENRSENMGMTPLSL